MSKTQLTLDIEEALYLYELEHGEIVVEEVSMPDDYGIVDTLALRTKPDGTYEFRCYEVKVSKSDFRSTAKLSFVGHYNYYVLPQVLFEQVKEVIPAPIGVIVYLPFEKSEEDGAKGKLAIVKKARKQELMVEEAALLNRFMHSLFREVRKAKKVEKGLQFYSDQELISELAKRKKNDVSGSRIFFDRYVDEIEQEIVQELEEEILALKEEAHILKEKFYEKRRRTEAYE